MLISWRRARSIRSRGWRRYHHEQLRINERYLVTAAFGNKLLARRYNETDAHPNIAVLTGQSVGPYVLAQPIIAPRERLSCRKIVGTLFAGRELPVPPVNANAKFIALSDFGVIAKPLEKARLFAVSGGPFRIAAMRHCESQLREKHTLRPSTSVSAIET